MRGIIGSRINRRRLLRQIGATTTNKQTKGKYEIMVYKFILGSLKI